MVVLAETELPWAQRQRLAAPGRSPVRSRRPTGAQANRWVPGTRK
jgi:hypothetical protein